MYYICCYDYPRSAETPGTASVDNVCREIGRIMYYNGTDSYHDEIQRAAGYGRIYDEHASDTKGCRLWPNIWPNIRRTCGLQAVAEYMAEYTRYKGLLISL